MAAFLWALRRQPEQGQITSAIDTLLISACVVSGDRGDS